MSRPLFRRDLLRRSCRSLATIMLASLTSSFAPSLMAGDWNFGGNVEFNTHVRHSEHNRFPVPFPTGSNLETVDSGTHVEVSRLTVNLMATDHDMMTFRGKVDAFDYHDRNSTSDDKDIDVDRLWFRYGKETRPGFSAPDEFTYYGKIGKFGKFERQNDRHLESYGLVSTAFNRFEDHGLELGLGTKHFYARASLTAGNPVFIRDPNALAGDNGTSQRINTGTSDRESGVVVLYDAESEDSEWHSEYAEAGLGLGWRDSGESYDINVLAFAYKRKLKSSAELFGTLYGGDLDILSAPFSVVDGLNDDDKTEFGVNLWWYYKDFSLFGQVVSQDVGGLGRLGAEVELAYNLYPSFGFHYKQTPLLSRITPAIRYSMLNPDFSGTAPGSTRAYPAPSIWWDWEKYDIGATFEITPDLLLITEYAVNQFQRANKTEENNELLVTLRWSVAF